MCFSMCSCMCISFRARIQIMRAHVSVYVLPSGVWCNMRIEVFVCAHIIRLCAHVSVHLSFCGGQVFVYISERFIAPSVSVYSHLSSL